MTKEEKKAYSKNYYKSHKEYFLEHNKTISKSVKKGWWDNYCKTKNGRATHFVSTYKFTDKKKGFSTDQNIDEKWIIENIFNSSCIYCGESDWAKRGVDRIDNAKGHTPDNCVCACERCNKKRGDRYSVDEFVRIMKEKAVD